MDGWMPPSTLSSGKCELEVRLKGENDLLSSMSRENRREWRCGSDNVSLPYYFNSLPLSHCTMIPEARAKVFALPPSPFLLHFFFPSRCRCRHSWRAWWHRFPLTVLRSLQCLSLSRSLSALLRVVGTKGKINWIEAGDRGKGKRAEQVGQDECRDCTRAT